MERSIRDTDAHLYRIEHYLREIRSHQCGVTEASDFGREEVTAAAEASTAAIDRLPGLALDTDDALVIHDGLTIYNEVYDKDNDDVSDKENSDFATLPAYTAYRRRYTRRCNARAVNLPTASTTPVLTRRCTHHSSDNSNSPVSHHSSSSSSAHSRQPSSSASSSPFMQRICRKEVRCRHANKTTNKLQSRATGGNGRQTQQQPTQQTEQGVQNRRRNHLQATKNAPKRHNKLSLSLSDTSSTLPSPPTAPLSPLASTIGSHADNSRLNITVVSDLADTLSELPAVTPITTPAPIIVSTMAVQTEPSTVSVGTDAQPPATHTAPITVSTMAVQTEPSTVSVGTDAVPPAAHTAQPITVSTAAVQTEPSTVSVGTDALPPAAHTAPITVSTMAVQTEPSTVSVGTDALPPAAHTAPPITVSTMAVQTEPFTVSVGTDAQPPAAHTAQPITVSTIAVQTEPSTVSVGTDASLGGLPTPERDLLREAARLEREVESLHGMLEGMADMEGDEGIDERVGGEEGQAASSAAPCVTVNDEDVEASEVSDEAELPDAAITSGALRGGDAERHTRRNRRLVVTVTGSSSLLRLLRRYLALLRRTTALASAASVHGEQHAAVVRGEQAHAASGAEPGTTTAREATWATLASTEEHSSLSLIGTTSHSMSPTVEASDEGSANAAPAAAAHIGTKHEDVSKNTAANVTRVSRKLRKLLRRERSHRVQLYTREMEHYYTLQLQRHEAMQAISTAARVQPAAQPLHLQASAQTTSDPVCITTATSTSPTASSSSSSSSSFAVHDSGQQAAQLDSQLHTTLSSHAAAQSAPDASSSSLHSALPKSPSPPHAQEGGKEDIEAAYAAERVLSPSPDNYFPHEMTSELTFLGTATVMTEGWGAYSDRGITPTTLLASGRSTPPPLPLPLPYTSWRANLAPRRPSALSESAADTTSMNIAEPYQSVATSRASSTADSTLRHTQRRAAAEEAHEVHIDDEDEEVKAIPTQRTSTSSSDAHVVCAVCTPASSTEPEPEREVVSLTPQSQRVPTHRTSSLEVSINRHQPPQQPMYRTDSRSSSKRSEDEEVHRERRTAVYAEDVPVAAAAADVTHSVLHDRSHATRTAAHTTHLSTTYSYSYYTSSNSNDSDEKDSITRERLSTGRASSVSEEDTPHVLTQDSIPPLPSSHVPRPTPRTSRARTSFSAGAVKDASRSAAENADTTYVNDVPAVHEEEEEDKVRPVHGQSARNTLAQRATAWSVPFVDTLAPPPHLRRASARRLTRGTAPVYSPAEAEVQTPSRSTSSESTGMWTGRRRVTQVATAAAARAGEAAAMAREADTTAVPPGRERIRRRSGPWYADPRPLRQQPSTNATSARPSPQTAKNKPAMQRRRTSATNGAAASTAAPAMRRPFLPQRRGAVATATTGRRASNATQNTASAAARTLVRPASRAATTSAGSYANRLLQRRQTARSTTHLTSVSHGGTQRQRYRRAETMPVSNVSSETEPTSDTTTRLTAFRRSNTSRGSYAARHARTHAASSPPASSHPAANTSTAAQLHPSVSHYVSEAHEVTSDTAPLSSAAAAALVPTSGTYASQAHDNTARLAELMTATDVEPHYAQATLSFLVGAEWRYQRLYVDRYLFPDLQTRPVAVTDMASQHSNDE